MVEHLNRRNTLSLTLFNGEQDVDREWVDLSHGGREVHRVKATLEVEASHALDDSSNRLVVVDDAIFNVKGVTSMKGDALGNLGRAEEAIALKLHFTHECVGLHRDDDV